MRTSACSSAPNMELEVNLWEDDDEAVPWEERRLCCDNGEAVELWNWKFEWGEPKEDSDTTEASSLPSGDCLCCPFLLGSPISTSSRAA